MDTSSESVRGGIPAPACSSDVVEVVDEYIVEKNVKTTSFFTIFLNPQQIQLNYVPSRILHQFHNKWRLNLACRTSKFGELSLHLLVLVHQQILPIDYFVIIPDLSTLTV